MTSVFEEKNIFKAILRVSIPAMLGQLTTLIYNIADTFFVSMTKEPAMIAAVTLCAPVLIIIMSIAGIFGMGGSSIISRLLGEKNTIRAGVILNFCIYAMVFAGIITLTLGLICLTPLSHIVGADSENFAYTRDYLKYIFTGAPFIILANGFIHLMRSVGLIKESTVSLILGNAINIILDFVFIVLFNWGTAGAALATSTGFICASVYCIVCIMSEMRKDNELFRLKPTDFNPDMPMVKSVITIGIPGALITVLMSVSNIVLNNYIGTYGSDAVASYGIAYKIDMIPIMLSVGLAQGVTPLIGYYYGANEKPRLSRTMIYSIVYGMLLGLFFTVIFLLFGNYLSAIFLEDKNLIAQTGYFLKILCISAPLPGIINMVTQYFQALGKALPSLTITLLRNVVLFIPAVIILNHIWQLNGVIAAQPVMEVILTIVCIVMYVRDIMKYREI